MIFLLLVYFFVLLMCISQIAGLIFFIFPSLLQAMLPKKANIRITRLNVFVWSVVVTIILIGLAMISAALADSLLAGQKIASL